MKNLLIAAAFVAFALSPASGKNVACTGDNFARMTERMVAMPYGAKRSAIMKEIAAVNASLSNGDLSGACKHYVVAQSIQDSTLHFE